MGLAAGHEHFVQPKDAGNLVEVASAISDAVVRPIQWVHVPVPGDRDDDAYFAALRDLRLHRETELYLGLVHFTNGVEGARRRIAKRVVGEFGVATECGPGRRPPETIEPLMRIHTQVAAHVRGTAAGGSSGNETRSAVGVRHCERVRSLAASPDR